MGTRMIYDATHTHKVLDRILANAPNEHHAVPHLYIRETRYHDCDTAGGYTSNEAGYASGMIFHAIGKATLWTAQGSSIHAWFRHGIWSIPITGKVSSASL